MQITKKPYPKNSCVEMSRNLTVNGFYLQLLRSIFVEISSCVIVKTIIILSISVNSGG